MTYKNGFIIGFVVGILAFVFLSGEKDVTIDSISAKALVAFLAIIVFPVLSFGIGIGSIMEGHSIFGTTNDGFIYGFTAALDIPYLVYLIVQFSHGNLPFPW